MRKSKYLSGTGNIQVPAGGERTISPVSSMWKPLDSSHSHHHQSIRSSSTFGSNHYQALSHSTTNSSSIRNSPLSRSKAFCFNQFRLCVACYESKFIMIEPVVFLILFAVYFHKIVFELYAFNSFGQKFISSSHSNANGSTICLTTKPLDQLNMEDKFEYEVTRESNYTNGNVVERETGYLNMMVGMASGVFSIFGMLIVGPVANRFGRKTSFVMILAGMVLQMALTVAIIKGGINIHFFILGSSLRGFTGGVAGIYTITYSYIIEFGKEKTRRWLTLRIGFVETLSFIAVTLGLLIGGISINSLQCKFTIPAYIILLLAVCATLYVIIATGESRDHVYAHTSNRSPVVVKRNDKVRIGPKLLLLGVKLFFSKESPRAKLWLSLIVMMISVINSTGIVAILTLYLLHHPLYFSPLTIGLYLGLGEFLHGLILVIILPLLLAAGIHDCTIVILSTLLTMAANVSLSFVNAAWQAFLVVIAQSVEVFIVPTLKAMMSKSVPPEQQGALFSLISVVQVVGSIVAYGVYIPIYVAFLRGTDFFGVHSNASAYVFSMMSLLYIFTIPLVCILGIMRAREEKRKSRNRYSPLLSETETSSSAPISNEAPSCGHSNNKFSFEASIGQDIVDKEGSVKSQRQEQDRNWMDQSYSSLSEYHTNKQ